MRSEPIIVRYRPELNDIAKALSESPDARRFRWVLFTAASVAACYLGVQLVLGQPIAWLVYAGLAWFWGVSALFPALHYKRIARGTLTGKSADDLDTTLTFDHAGFSSEAPLGTARSSWSALHHVYEGPSAFLLYLNPTVYQILPKRAIDTRDLARLREMLREHVEPPAKARLRERYGVLVLWCLLIIVLAMTYWMLRR